MQIEQQGEIVEIRLGEYRLERVGCLTRAWGNGAMFDRCGEITAWSKSGKSTSLRIARTTIKKMIEAAK